MWTAYTWEDMPEFNPNFLWALFAPGTVLIILIAILIFIILRRMKKGRSHRKLLEETYGIADPPPATTKAEQAV